MEAANTVSLFSTNELSYSVSLSSIVSGSFFAIKYEFPSKESSASEPFKKAEMVVSVRRIMLPKFSVN